MSAARSTWEPGIGEGELIRLTKGMQEAHMETLPALHEGAAELVEEIGREDAGRRCFLAGAGIAAAAAAFALVSATGSGKAFGAGTAPGRRAVAPSPYQGDLKVVALAAALENQAVGAYGAALKAADAGKLGKVPPAVGTFAKTAMDQHAAHAKAWNAVLTGAGRPAITGVPLSNQPATVKALGRAKDVGAVARLALALEDQAAQTYLFAVGHVSSPAGIGTAASIAPVEAMHAAILHFVLGEYPVPDAFLQTDKAAEPALLTI
ncbi:ferritin-like domain-containing protein [Streptomyces sp. NBC_01264]|uniref:ferritin-like domain-containing protein n=1 Tax=Streptomyces sp. NBC_01264 TaxID=2903804 RepID=UPI0022558CE0|nr:ferritin-like domain-containing protein [Streptomyces sp. NBC_01264]MCX4776615.1 ferritin-like domain-containing protein [Streptomyces sp. NBC_01264]